MAAAYKRLGQVGDAISALNQAIDMQDEEQVKYRIPVAYWNRACYEALILDQPEEDRDISRIIDDLREAIRLEPSFAHDLTKESDLDSLKYRQEFLSFIEECKK